MKRLLLGLGVLGLLGAAVAWSGPGQPLAEFRFTLEERNPVSHLRLNNGPDSFQFVIISDRTGGHRAQVFSQAVHKINLLQPEFVVSVGDLIEGYTNRRPRLEQEWREFQTYISELDMPFFYVPGNHDISNKDMETLWKEKFGRRFYHFTYKNVLFLMLNSEDPPGQRGQISTEQINYVKQTLEANPDSRWTLIFLHKPLWVSAFGYDVARNGWGAVEKLLAGRPHTVFAGHVHRYRKFVRQGQNYYMLATTGGSSRLRGTDYGEFDHLVWVTMKKDGPVLANILLDGVLRENLQPIHTGEPGHPRYNRQPTYPARGSITFEGKPLAGAYVVLTGVTEEGKQPARADALTRADGTFTLSTYQANDGAAAGKYTITVVWRKPFYTPEGKPGPNLLPPRYASDKTSGLKTEITRDDNIIRLLLSR
jgi:predicted phosphodiesterase